MKTTLNHELLAYASSTCSLAYGKSLLTELDKTKVNIKELILTENNILKLPAMALLLHKLSKDYPTSNCYVAFLLIKI